MTTTLHTPETLLDGPFGARLLIDATDFSLVEHPIAPRTLAGPSHVHQHEDEYSYVLEGEVGFEIGDDVFTAGPGQLVAKPRGIWHAFWNAGDGPARVLEVIAPAGFEKYFAELAPLLPPNLPAPDLEAIAELRRATASRWTSRPSSGSAANTG
jgi:mannose-6-phosphate isomerase-like protein (cupin superfamily)